MSTDGTDPAFPVSSEITAVEPWQWGLTKREVMAKDFCAGLLAADAEQGLDYDRAADQAVKHADALIERLNQEKTP